MMNHLSRGSFLATGAALAASSQPALAQAPAPAHLIVGAAAIDGAIGLITGQNMGFFKKNGVDVEHVVNNGAASAAGWRAVRFNSRPRTWSR